QRRRYGRGDIGGVDPPAAALAAGADGVEHEAPGDPGADGRLGQGNVGGREARPDDRQQGAENEKQHDRRRAAPHHQGTDGRGEGAQGEADVEDAGGGIRHEGPSWSRASRWAFVAAARSAKAHTSASLRATATEPAWRTSP